MIICDMFGTSPAKVLYFFNSIRFALSVVLTLSVMMTSGYKQYMN